jgi:hypothetical protein
LVFGLSVVGRDPNLDLTDVELAEAELCLHLDELPRREYEGVVDLISSGRINISSGKKGCS